MICWSLFLFGFNDLDQYYLKSPSKEELTDWYLYCGWSLTPILAQGVSVGGIHRNPPCM